MLSEKRQCYWYTRHAINVGDMPTDTNRAAKPTQTSSSLSWCRRRRTSRRAWNVSEMFEVSREYGCQSKAATSLQHVDSMNRKFCYGYVVVCYRLVAVLSNRVLCCNCCWYLRHATNAVRIPKFYLESIWASNQFIDKTHTPHGHRALPSYQPILGKHNHVTVRGLPTTAQLITLRSWTCGSRSWLP